ncbi:integrin alpha-5-like [Anthonomus grandis grandis]|uniref:integrin alpha-5-like n=1 Tax=Anthonomus grandis grandis TaxID=2921223 RepID=UPI00216536CB|nr:integrin alpha-5-like [Anthonomus grandis grandis]
MRISLSIFLILISKSLSFTFHDPKKPIISNPKGTYLGYSVLLQKTHVPDHFLVIVGAPKDRVTNGTHHGGQVLKCKLNQVLNPECETLFGHGIPIAWTTHGDFLGATVDGHDHSDGYIVGCSPRDLLIKKKSPKTPYSYGSCFFKKGAEKSHFLTPEMFKGEAPLSAKLFDGNLVYNYAYALFGFSIALYNNEMVFSGAPKLKPTGSIMQLGLPNFENAHVRSEEVLVEPQRYFPQEDSNYLGYAVYVAKNEFNGETWFFAGSPRADPSNLLGKVTVYTLNQRRKFEEIHTEWGKEFGSYFASSLLSIDLNRDGILDLLVGAPTSGGSTYDEGRVYSYLGLPFDKGYQKRQTTIKTVFFQERQVKLTGSNRPGARFGTSITSIGDFDLDGFNDVAISAPYEDNGRGAVYIYKGGPEGLEFSQRLIGADDSKGFGAGLSRGNDVDNNGHNDIAIGAYKTDQVFLSKSKAIVEYSATLGSSIKAIKETTDEFKVFLDLDFRTRSHLVHVKEVGFMVDIRLDYRAKMERVNEMVVVPSGGKKTVEFIVKLKPMKKDFSSFKFEAALNPLGTQIVALGPKKVEKNFRYDIGCGNGNVCMTGIRLTVISNRKSIVLGSDVTDFALELLVSNAESADPAYNCEFIIRTPGFIVPKNSSCRSENDEYVCPFRDKLAKGSMGKELYTFDIKNLDLNNLEIPINISVQCAGRNSEKYSGLHQTVIKIPIVVNSTSNVFGKSVPENIALLRTIESNDSEVVHKFTISKYGPSPLTLNLTLLVPLIKRNHQDDLVNILEIMGAIEGNSADLITCQESKDAAYVGHKEVMEHFSDQLEMFNGTILVFCDGVYECKRFNCTGVLRNSNEKAVVEVRMVFVAKLFAKQFSDELITKNRIAYLPILLQQNTTDRLLVTSTFSIIFEEFFYIPLWTFLIASQIGTVLLMAVIFILYKCQFFKREYKVLVKEGIAEAEAEKRTSMRAPDSQTS